MQAGADDSGPDITPERLQNFFHNTKAKAKREAALLVQQEQTQAEADQEGGVAAGVVAAQSAAEAEAAQAAAAAGAEVTAKAEAAHRAECAERRKSRTAHLVGTRGARQEALRVLTTQDRNRSRDVAGASPRATSDHGSPSKKRRQNSGGAGNDENAAPTPTARPTAQGDKLR